MKIYIITAEINDYNQYGNYFVCAVKDLPNLTYEQLNKKISEQSQWFSFYSDDDDDIKHEGLSKYQFERYIKQRKERRIEGNSYDDEWLKVTEIDL